MTEVVGILIETLLNLSCSLMAKLHLEKKRKRIFKREIIT